MSIARRESIWRVRLEPQLAITAAMLLLLGLLTVASSSVAIADRNMGEPFYYFYRQLAYLGVAAAVSIIVMLTPMRAWESLSIVALAMALMLLVIVVVPGVGHTVNGSTRWLPLGPVRLQASEPARLLLLIYISGYLVRRHDEVRSNLSGFLKPMGIISVAFMLLMMQPDFGAATVLLAAVLGVMFVGGVRISHLLGFVALATAALSALVLTSTYRLQRLTAFLDPWADPFDSGFQLTQSLIAVGRGGLLGVGLGGSVQKLFYLPEAHTDFVYSVIAEELGLLGAIGTLGLFVFLIWRCFAIARDAGFAGLAFQAYLVYGIGIWMGAQAMVNIGVSMGALPTKGLTLPFISYGGSSLLVCCVALALVLRTHHETQMAGRAASPRRKPSRRSRK